MDKIYKSNRIAFFASVIEYIDDDLISFYKDKSSGDGKEDFYYILASEKDF